MSEPWRSGRTVDADGGRVEDLADSDVVLGDNGTSPTSLKRDALASSSRASLVLDNAHKDDSAVTACTTPEPRPDVGVIDVKPPACLPKPVTPVHVVAHGTNDTRESQGESDDQAEQSRRMVAVPTDGAGRKAARGVWHIRQPGSGGFTG